MDKLSKKGPVMFLMLVAFIWPLFGGNVALSAEFPTKPIEIVIPWSAGGRSDIGSRTMAPFLEKYLGVPVVVINKVGGAGLVAFAYLRDAKPDGYTISYGGYGVLLLQYTRPEGVVSLGHYTFIAQVYSAPMVVTVNTKSPFNTLKDLVEYGRTNPGKLKHGNTTTGSSSHIASEGFAKKHRIKITQVPYKGEGDTAKGLAAGEVDFCLGLYISFRPLIESGHLRVLGVADANRNPLYPQIPTGKEEGFDFSFPNWEAIFAPKGLPQNVYDKLSEACKSALENPQLKESYAKMGLNILYRPGPELTQYIKSWDKDSRDLILIRSPV